MVASLNPKVLFDLFDPVELMGYARKFLDETLRFQFTMNQYLPDEHIEDLEYKVRKSALIDVDAAEFRAWDTPPRMTGRPGTSRIRGEIAPISRQIALAEEEGLRLRSLMTQNDNPIIDKIFDDVERMVRSVAARIEMARVDAMIDGKVTINENGLQLEADYGMPAEHQVTVANAWTLANSATATPVSDFLAAQQTLLLNTGQMAGKIIMSRKRLPALQKNLELRQFAASTAVIPPRLDLGTIQGILADNDIPPIEFYDVMVRINGVQTRILPDDKVLMVPAEPFGATYFGPTAEAVLLAERGLIKAQQTPGIMALVTQNENPVQTFTTAVATALPVIPNPELMFTLDVGDPSSDTPTITPS